MREAGIFRDKFRQSYYNDKHQDPVVVEDRSKYIKVMDDLSLRMPLWLHLSAEEFASMRERMPSDGLLVHHYDVGGVAMVEVHVDLDDSFDAMRAALPLGGHFSVRFPGGCPPNRVLTFPPAGLSSPGVELNTDLAAGPPPDNTQEEVGDGAPPPTMPTVAMVNKMKVAELRDNLQALGLACDGLKPALHARLLEAVRKAAPPAAVNESEDSDDEEWKVKKILGRRVVTHVVDDISFDVVEYQVQWDYPDEDDPTSDEVTWEVESNMTNATEALHEFLSSQPRQQGCSFGHMEGVCRCGSPLIHAGQDESIFKAYQKSSFQWVVQGVRGLRKKTDGPGEMISGFKDEIRGFGHPLSRAELASLNAFRKARGRDALTASPCVRFLSYGKNKDGYWRYEHFAEQVTDVLDMYESVYPNAQVLIEVDWSSGHSKHREDALNVASMSVTFGCKQSIPHPSQMVEGCLHEGATLKEGDLQFFYFRSADERRLDGATDGMPDPPPFYRPDLSPNDYIGLAKGKKQILYERGLWKPGMVEKVDDDDPKGRDQSMSMDYVLGNCLDFRNETSALQTLVESRGHILIMSPKGHCELAGVPTAHA